jgi:hypothetical protein
MEPGGKQLQKKIGQDGRTDGRMDGWMDGIDFAKFCDRAFAVNPRMVMS